MVLNIRKPAVVTILVKQSLFALDFWNEIVLFKNKNKLNPAPDSAEIFKFFLFYGEVKTAEWIGPYPVASPLRSFPCDFRPHFHPHCYRSPCTLTFYIFHTHTHPPSYPCLDNLLTLQYFPLTSGCLHHIMSSQMPHSLRNLSWNFQLCSEFT